MRWPIYFFLWIAGITAAGAVLGALIFVVAGIWFSELSSASLAIEGGRRMGFIFSIWAPAIATAATIMRAYRRRTHFLKPAE